MAEVALAQCSTHRAGATGDALWTVGGRYDPHARRETAGRRIAALTPTVGG